MFPIAHYFNGFIKNLFNPRISIFSLVSINNVIDPKSCIYRFCKVKGSKIGAYSYIGNGTTLENAEIGKYCSISDNCRIGMGSHTLNLLSTCPLFTEAVNGTQYKWVENDVNAAENKRVIIGNDVWIGYQSIILGGIKIGDGAVVGAGAVVVKDVPPYSVVGGVPAKVLKYRFSDEIIKELLSIKWWDLPEQLIISNIKLFQQSPIHVENLKKLKKDNEI